MLQHPVFDSDGSFPVLTVGSGVSPGAARGHVVFTAQSAVREAAAGRDVILLRATVGAEDVAGFHAARGIVTSEGGRASHATLLARTLGRPAVTGARGLVIDPEEGLARVGGAVLREGDLLAIDGSRGVITTADLAVTRPEVDEALLEVLSWTDAVGGLVVRANADTPEDARRAREMGARGVGLCRTEHMFMTVERQPAMRAMVMASGHEERRDALSHLLPMQCLDFERIFTAAGVAPVTIRLLDPPLHEFLPDADDLLLAVERARVAGDQTDEVGRQLDRVRALREVNPMLGTRGVRLGMRFPDIYEMQVRAMAAAARTVGDRTGSPPRLEIMVPLVDYERELEAMERLVKRITGEHGLVRGVDYRLGVAVEVPRACLIADRLALRADFLSFGTNDLTQTALGLSRDDAEGSFLDDYVREGVIGRSPFETLDEPGVGRLVSLGADLARSVSSELTLGVCGEHGGDPDSITFFHGAGLDYVSCSPYRVPCARLSVAQAAIAARAQNGGAQGAPGPGPGRHYSPLDPGP